MTATRNDSRPRVTVAMVVRRPEPRIFRESVASVLSQTLDDLELIVVETPSDRDAKAILAEFADPRIRHLAVPEDTALAQARNESLAYARAPLVAILDADDVAEPERLAVQTAFLDAHPEVGVVGSAVRLIREDGTVIGVRRYPEVDTEVRRTMRRRNPIAQPSAMVRRDVIRACGGYVCRPAGTEDYDLWCRMVRAGIRFANLPEPLTRYRIHPTSLTGGHVRATLRDTLRIKQEYFAGELDLRDRLRMLGERALLLLPARWVRRLFLRTAVDPEVR